MRVLARMISTPTKVCVPRSSSATRASLFRTHGTVVAWLWNIRWYLLFFEYDGIKTHHVKINLKSIVCCF